MKQVKPALDALEPADALAALRDAGQVTVQLEAGPAELTSAEVQAVPVFEGERAAAHEGGTIVLLDLELDEELVVEGLARELVRKLQDLRKSEGLEIEQRIALRLHTDDAQLRAALERHGDTIGAELLAPDLSLESAPPAGARTLEIRDGKTLAVELR
jgi:isoleucyl-tRNA synthetase